MALSVEDLKARLEVKERVRVGTTLRVSVTFENERVMKYTKDGLFIFQLSDTEGFFRMIRWKGITPTLLLELECIPEPPHPFPQGNIITLECVEAEPPKKP